MRGVHGYVGSLIKGEEFAEKEAFYKYVMQPDKVISASLGFKSSRGFEMVKAFRVQHKAREGRYKGGFRILPSVSLEVLQELALLMSLKHSLYELPFGGAKGGMSFDRRLAGRKEMRNLMASFVERFACDMERDIIAPDMGMDQELMDAILESLARIKGSSSASTVVGKSQSKGGVAFRRSSTGYGVAYTLHEFNKRFSLGITKVGIHGFGKVGIHAALTLEKMGFEVVGVSDSSGGVISERGLAVEEVILTKRNKGSVVYHPSKVVKGDEFLAYPFDALVLASKEGVINSKNAGSVKAKLLVEGANMPITHEAEEILKSKGAIVVPDILANAGGAFVSYYEWLKSKGEEVEEERIRKALEDKISRLVAAASQDTLRELRRFYYLTSLRKLHSEFTASYCGNDG